VISEKRFQIARDQSVLTETPGLEQLPEGHKGGKMAR
jgi:hypothetical protein